MGQISLPLTEELNKPLKLIHVYLNTNIILLDEIVWSNAKYTIVKTTFLDVTKNIEINEYNLITNVTKKYKNICDVGHLI